MFKTTFRWLKRIVLWLWLLAMFVIGMLVFNENREVIQVNFILFEVEAIPLGMLLCGLLLVGGLLGYCTSYLQFKTREVLLARHYKKATQSIDKLKMDARG